MGADSLRLIAVDPSTGVGISTPYNFVLSFHGQGVFVPSKKQYYVFQQDAQNKMCLVRYDLEKNKTDILRYSGALDLVSNPYNFELFYSGKYNTFYYIYPSWRVYSSDQHKLFELTVSDTGCTDKEILITPRPIEILYPIVNPTNGNICFYSYNNYYVVDPTSNKVNTFPQNDIIIHQSFNPNNSLFYGIKTYTDPAEFCQMSPITGEITKIRSLNFSIENRYRCATFDTCMNQYILQIDGSPTETPASIYWIDVNTGNIVKEVHSNDQYMELTSTEK
jgi:hypothetical protein